MTFGKKNISLPNSLRIKVYNVKYCVIFFLLLIPEREEGRERKRKGNTTVRNIDRLPPAETTTRDQTCNPGMCPDWDSTLRPFGVWDDTQLTEPHWPGLRSVLPKNKYSKRGKHAYFIDAIT